MLLYREKGEKMTDNKLKLSPPWVTYAHELEALFGEDPAIKVVFDDGDDKEITLFVEGSEKADALMQLLPVKKDFGGVSVRVTVRPANDDTYVPSKADLIAKAFENNPVLSNIIDTGPNVAFPATYFVFANKVVQYYNDQMDNPYGIKSTLYENIARDVLDDSGVGVYYTTDVPMKDDGAFREDGGGGDSCVCNSDGWNN